LSLNEQRVEVVVFMNDAYKGINLILFSRVGNLHWLLKTTK